MFVGGRWHTLALPAAPDGVERHYFKRFSDSEDERNKLVGRQVVIFPTTYTYTGFTRGEDQYRHEVSVLTIERYDGAGDPPRDWIDARVDFTYTYIVQGFDYTVGPTWAPRLLTDSAEIQVCDIEKLTSGGRLFYSLVSIVFLELVDAA